MPPTKLFSFRHILIMILLTKIQLICKVQFEAALKVTKGGPSTFFSILICGLFSCLSQVKWRSHALIEQSYEDNIRRQKEHTAANLRIIILSDSNM